MKYWLMKSEPTVYSITNLQQDDQTIWDGVRNYQARNFLRQIDVGDRAFFYHSNTIPPAIVGLMTIIENKVTDPTQFNRDSPYYDPKSTVDSPRWQTVKVQFLEVFSNMVTLDTLKETFNPEDLLVVKRGNRLSVIPVNLTIAEQIIELSR
jgi:predicted RNA-binding protein with PUA-like domain